MNRERQKELDKFRGITRDYLKLLIAIQESPLATLDWLAKRTKTSKPTLAKRLAILEGSHPDRMFANDPEQGRVFSVAPILSYHNLGFEYFGTIIETNTLKQTKKLEKLIGSHPYIRHRSRCYGAANGLLLQFRYPEGSRGFIIEFLERLVADKIVIAYHPLASDQTSPVYTSLNAKGWDPSSLTWDFDWDDWYHKEGTTTPLTKPSGPSGKALSWLTKKDIYLINEALTSSRRKNKEILISLREKGVEFTPQTFSRRYATLKEECFIRYRTFITPTIFDVYNTVILTGQGTRKYLRMLASRLDTHPIPFGSTMRIEGNNLFWYIRLQGAHLSKLISRVSSDLENLSVFLLDYSESMRYLLEPDAYNETKHSWIQDENFMIEDVLRNM
ncbi:MAG: hypothetical protein ACFFF4_18030 [Candidatus Thorarchaeota archaeon]